MKQLKSILVVSFAMMLSFCSSGGGDQPQDGGQDGQNTIDQASQKCGSQYCAASESCLAGEVCVGDPTSTARACEEDPNKENIYNEVEDGDLSCHNSLPCPDEQCPQQLSCKDGTCGVPAPGGPDRVIFRGCVDAFGIGDITSGMKLALYLPGQDPSGTPSQVVDTIEDRSSCEYWGYFEFTDVPTNTPLVLKSYDEQGDFVPVYKYNLVLWSDLAQQEGNDWVFDTRATVTDPRTGQQISLNPWRGYAISQSTYNVILMAVGVTLGDNQGAIAGTIRDCRYRELANIKCGTAPQAEVVTYFSNAENPRPELSRNSTNVNGIYAAIGIDAGNATLACQGLDAEGNKVPFGAYRVKVFPKSISIVSFDWYPAVQ
ncbi:MAG: hypothetical protein D6806_17420 [Deltaproteobacteria bacterium]|nr:MAG: hypothetical protein D6806_17420 [Deltaproteobacteria bacterium]